MDNVCRAIKRREISMEKIKIKRMRENAAIPTKGSEKSAGYDLYACLDKPVFINPHETVMISTGVSMELPDGTFGAIVSRSGISVKRGWLLQTRSVSVIRTIAGSIWLRYITIRIRRNG